MDTLGELPVCVLVTVHFLEALEKSSDDLALDFSPHVPGDFLVHKNGFV